MILHVYYLYLNTFSGFLCFFGGGVFCIFCCYSFAFSCAIFPVLSLLIFMLGVLWWFSCGNFSVFPLAFSSVFLCRAIYFVLPRVFLFLFSRFSPFSSSMCFCPACFHALPRDLPNNQGQATKTLSILVGAFSCLFWWPLLVKLGFTQCTRSGSFQTVFASDDFTIDIP